MDSNDMADSQVVAALPIYELFSTGSTTMSLLPCRAESIIARSYAVYLKSSDLRRAIRKDVRVRDFSMDSLLPADLTDVACRVIDLVAGSRNLTRF